MNSNTLSFLIIFVRFLIFIFGLPAFGAVREVASIGLTVSDLPNEVFFFTNVLKFVEVSSEEATRPETDQLLGKSNTKLRISHLRLGEERITLTQHLTSPGRQIPADSRSFDHWFQHIAIVVSDMDAAYAQLRSHKVKHVSTAPQTLPAWNTEAGGIKAFYFQDPEAHVLEVIWFPPGKGDPKWQRPHPNSIFLGIDHTAIVVSDTDRSLAFYRDVLGMNVAGESENYGVEQEHLNQVFGVRLRITSLRAQSGPGIEFLEYVSPPGGRALPSDSSSSDLIFWNTRLIADGCPELLDQLRAKSTTFISVGNSNRSAIVRDPDGHALELDSFSTRVAQAGDTAR